jgi:hypothetical protein
MRNSGCRGCGIFRDSKNETKYRVISARNSGIGGSKANLAMNPDTFEFFSDTAVRNLYAIGLHLDFGSRADAGPLRLEAAQGPGADGTVIKDKGKGTGCWGTPGASPRHPPSARRTASFRPWPERSSREVPQKNRADRVTNGGNAGIRM